MLDIEFIRQNKALIQKAAKDKKIDVDIDVLLELDGKRGELITTVEAKRHEHNELAQKTKAKPSAADIAVGKKLKSEVAELDKKLEAINQKYLELANQIPNPAHQSVPVGKDESGNKVERQVGKVTEFKFKARDHVELGELNQLIDIETAAKTSGSRFYYLKNGAVILEFALVQWLLGKLITRGFTPVITPQLVREQMMFATGFFPADKNEIYQVNSGEDDLYLIGTSEVPMAGLHMLAPLDLKDLPKRYAGFSTCFRREAGSYGKDVKGIFRVHQFDKLEMYSYTEPDKSWAEHEFLLAIEEEILQELELAYQVVNICTGDLGVAAAKKYDCEVWFPAQKRYRELTSCSNTTDFQARRGGIKYHSGDKTDYVHTLNGTAMASARTLAAILENYQTKDGKIKVPKVLTPYVGREFV